MPYTFEWLEKPHIAYLWLTGDLTEAEFSAFVDEAIAMIASVPETKIRTLINLEGLKKFPSLAFLARELKRLMANSNRAMSTVYGVGRLTRYVLELIVRVSPIRLKIFDTREEALGFIHDLIRREQALAAEESAAEVVADETPAG
jgi:hypothetical protein